MSVGIDFFFEFEKVLVAELVVSRLSISDVIVGQSLFIYKRVEIARKVDICKCEMRAEHDLACFCHGSVACA